MAVPGAPTGLTLTAGDNRARVVFAAVTATPTVGKYQYNKDGGAYVDTPSSGASRDFYVEDLRNGTQYAIRVRAVNADGNGTASSAVNVTPVNATADDNGFTDPSPFANPGMDRNDAHLDWNDPDD